MAQRRKNKFSRVYKVAKVLKECYLTKTGKRLLQEAKTEKAKEEVWKKYGKNRYFPRTDFRVARLVQNY